MATVLAFAGIGTASAFAATVAVSGTTIQYTAAAAETNNLTVTLEGGNYVFRDAGAAITPTPPCTGGPPQEARCPEAGITSISVSLADGADTLSAASLSITVSASGGSGGDSLTTGSGDDSLNGNAGSDLLIGGGGDDVLVGDDPGGPFGSDDLRGGDGFDTVDLTDHDPLGVTVTLDDLANDGTATEADNVRSDIEDIIGTGAADSIHGSGAFNSISSGAGNDTIDPGTLEDIVFAGAGDDTVNTRDGYADRIECDGGADTANVDTLDVVNTDCETVNRADVGTARDVPEVPEDQPPTVALTSPPPGAGLSSSTPTTLTATAGDDRGVARVVFLDDDRVVCTDEAAPYDCSYQPRGEDVGRNTLAVVAQDTAGQVAFATATVNVLRFNSPGLTIRTRPSRDATPPFTFTTTGRLRLPAAVTPALGCAGIVTVQFQAGRKTVSSRRVQLSRSCTYRSRVRFEIPRRLDPRTLRVRAIFAGNEVLLREVSRRIRVRVK